MVAERSSRDLWIFGYGSLIWRPGFDHVEQRPASIRDHARRFWQGSTDHRGVPGAPGRVVTLIPEPDAVCWGVAFRVAAERRSEVLHALDHRERGGFDRISLDLHFREGRPRSASGLAYVAREDNPNYLGPASMDAIAYQVQRSRGPSGANREYVLRLAEALSDHDLVDEHVFTVAARVARLGPADS
jgi:cation transport regulator ChaC